MDEGLRWDRGLGCGEERCYGFGLHLSGSAVLAGSHALLA